MSLGQNEGQLYAPPPGDFLSCVNTWREFADFIVSLAYPILAAESGDN